MAAAWRDLPNTFTTRAWAECIRATSTFAVATHSLRSCCGSRPRSMCTGLCGMLSMWPAQDEPADSSDTCR
jgi:hypothetical protein